MLQKFANVSPKVRYRPVALSDLSRYPPKIKISVASGISFRAERRSGETKKRTGTMVFSSIACITLEAANYCRETKVSARSKYCALVRKPGYNSCLPRRNRFLAISRSSLFVNFSLFKYPPPLFKIPNTVEHNIINIYCQ